MLHPDEKLKAKLIVDTVFQRLGDVLGAIFFSLFHSFLAFPPGTIAFFAAGLCVGWGVVSWTLARHVEAMM